MNNLSALKKDYIILKDLHAQRAAAPTDGMSFGIRTLYGIYINILADALSVLNSLIEHLNNKQQ